MDLIDVRKRRQVASIPVGKRPRGIGFLPDGRAAYVACELAGKVYVIDLAKQQGATVIEINLDPTHTTAVDIVLPDNAGKILPMLVNALK